ncbi:hypothetical protein [Bradyrhizobium manausense]|uniref:hypothetical protein n=1 Tax=Bradyrhizobium manausense TaxID=989370 RepID=UPI001BA5AAE1|nr:hypothetical protein [Bradyrhizobium manausense]MBR0724145.1 hypothetical protein [Bradyrhizobium manausense]
MADASELQIHGIVAMIATATLLNLLDIKSRQQQRQRFDDIAGLGSVGCHLSDA